MIRLLLIANKINYGSKTTNTQAHPAQLNPGLNTVEAERWEPVDFPAQLTLVTSQ